MFLAILTYKEPLSEVDKYLQAHRDYLAEHYAAGDFFTSGPQNPRIGGKSIDEIKRGFNRE